MLGMESGNWSILNIILNQYFLMNFRPIPFCKEKLKRAGPSEPALLPEAIQTRLL
jgi:hypothetical protein